MIQTERDNLPVLASMGSEQFRRDLAINDLILGQQADHAGLLEYAQAASHEVLAKTAHSARDLPYLDGLNGIAVRVQGDEAVPDEQMTIGDVMHSMIGADVNAQGVDRKDIKREASRILHPDLKKQDSVEKEAAAEKLAAINNAVSTEDGVTAQALYAGTITDIALRDVPRLSATQLQRARWKIHVAKNASKTRFSSKKEIDEWKADAIADVDLGVRANAASNLTGLIIQWVGTQTEEGLEVSGEHQDLIAQIQRLRQSDLFDEAKRSSMRKADFTRIDEAIEDAVDFFDMITGDTPKYSGFGWVYRLAELPIYLAAIARAAERPSAMPVASLMGAMVINSVLGGKEYNKFRIPEDKKYSY